MLNSDDIIKLYKKAWAWESDNEREASAAWLDEQLFTIGGDVIVDVWSKLMSRTGTHSAEEQAWYNKKLKYHALRAFGIEDKDEFKRRMSR